ncbi:MAG TPA: TonB-dependent receptor [Ignavibacteria bacterium]|nr:TonB-dependent receptor [Ignavibacteria bacterium]
MKSILVILNVILICIFIFCNLSFAQQNYSGVVFDKTSNEPVQDAFITNLSEIVLSTTNSQGRFNFTSIFEIDSLIISAPGFKTTKIKLTGNTVSIALIKSNYSVEEIIVSSNRETQKRNEAPISIQTITKSIINDTKATRLDMLLNKASGVYMIDLGNEQHTMSIRQPINYNSVYLYLEDGIPIRTIGDFNHNALIEINQSSLSRIEIIKGPASSLYGSEAIGGVVNFISQSPSVSFLPKIQAEIGSRGYKRTDLSISNSIKNFGYSITGYYANQNESQVFHNNFDKGAVTLRGDYYLNDKTKLSSSVDYINYKTDQKGGLDSVNFFSKNYNSNYRFTYRKVNSVRFKTILSHQWNKSENSNVTLIYRNSAIGQNPFYRISNVQNNPLKANGQINEDAFQSFAGYFQHSKKFNFLNSKLIIGGSLDYSPATYYAKYISIDRNSDKVYYAYTETDSLLTDYKVDLINSALYSQFEINPADKLKLIAALRYDRMDYDFINYLPPSAFTGAPSTVNNFNHLTPKVGLTYSFNDYNGVYANYSVGFTPPNITDLYTGVKVPFLKPSTYNNYEIGGWFNFISGRGFIELSFYRLDGFNEIVSVRLADGTYEKQNVGETRHIGIEANINYSPIDELYLRAGTTFAHHEYIAYSINGVDLAGKDMSQAPSYILNSEITYKPNFIKGLRVSAEWQSLGKYFTDPQNTAVYDGYNIFNLRSGYRFKSFEVWVNCLNIADEVYATTVEKSAFGTSFRPGQLRTFNIGINYTFNSDND